MVNDINMKITFELDGTGVIMNLHDAIHIDSLLQWSMIPPEKFNTLGRNEVPNILDLPLSKWTQGGTWGYCASALLPEGETAESLHTWRKRFRTEFMEKTDGTVNLQSNTYKSYNVPMPLILCHKMVGYATGDIEKVNNELQKIRFLGKKRSQGRGSVTSVCVGQIEQDYSIQKNGVFLRFMPDKNGARIGRVRPPYWNQTETMKTCFVGDNVA